MEVPKEFIIQHALRNTLNTGRSELFSPNANVYDWESDLLCITKSRYVHEYEIKCSRADLLNDRKKKYKHQGLKAGKMLRWPAVHEAVEPKRENVRVQGENWEADARWLDHYRHIFENPTYEPVPNYFWYVCVGFDNFKIEELPEHAGVIKMSMPGPDYPYAQLETLRGAPRLHKEKLSDEYVIKALKSIQYRFWDIHSRKYFKD